MLTVELSFATKHLRRVCTDEDAAIREFGVDIATALKGRLADFRAASAVHELVAGRPRTIDGDEPRFAVDLVEGHAITCRPNHEVLPMIDEALDWPRVRRLHVLAIEQVRS